MLAHYELYFVKKKDYHGPQFYTLSRKISPMNCSTFLWTVSILVSSPFFLVHDACLPLVCILSQMDKKLKNIKNERTYSKNNKTINATAQEVCIRQDMSLN